MVTYSGVYFGLNESRGKVFKFFNIIILILVVINFVGSIVIVIIVSVCFNSLISFMCVVQAGYLFYGAFFSTLEIFLGCSQAIQFDFSIRNFPFIFLMSLLCFLHTTFRISKSSKLVFNIPFVVRHVSLQILNFIYCLL